MERRLGGIETESKKWQVLKKADHAAQAGGKSQHGIWNGCCFPIGNMREEP
jgi:hypothetical protein